MKSWRTITAAVLVASAPATALFAGGKCVPNLNLTTVFPLVMCVERTSTSSNNVGNLYPWVVDNFFFANYRNQYLYPSSTLQAVSARAATIESIHSRAVSFTGAATDVYGSAATDNRIRIEQTSTAVLNKNFASNLSGGTSYMNWVGPKTISTVVGSAVHAGGGSALLSDFVSRGSSPATRNDIGVIDFRVVDPSKTNILLDQLMRLTAAGNSGYAVWDVTSGACSQPKRAYGSSSFFNVNMLTTAYGVDTFAFVWVFRGQALPPPSTMQQQVADIIRLLITPEGLRCAGLDLTPNGKVNDDPLNFPDGKDWDPSSPQVTNGGLISGEKAKDGKRDVGWQ